MTTALTIPGIDRDKLDLIKETVAQGVTDLELQLFLHHCERTGLDPLMDQVYAIPRWDAKSQRNVMKIQTGIAGLRLIADRTKNYAPGPRAVFQTDETGQLVSAIASVKKRTDDGIWHLVEGEAFFEEYAQRTRTGEITTMWKKGRTMLAKCAEALAIKKAFPAETSGLFIREEMMAETEHKPIRTGAEMLAEMEAKEQMPSNPAQAPISNEYVALVKGSVHEPAVEEVMEDLEKAAALSMPTPGNPPSIYTFTDKLDNAESIKEWSDVMNEAQRYDWNAEQRTRLDDHAQRAKKRLTTKAKK